jgi:Sulfotransferase domain
MTKTRRFPNLFLLGAPKCGTTSLVHWLGQHPEVFAPVLKDPCYFGSDLIARSHLRSEEKYLALYKNWKSERFAMDATPVYLCSLNAPREIAENVKSPKFIVMIRNPVEACYSLFHENRFDGIEELPRFEDALNAEADRIRRSYLPRHGIAQIVYYRKMYEYTAQIRRFAKQFGPQALRLIVLDDIQKNNNDEFVKVLEFLEIDTQCAHKIDFSIKNKAKKARSRMAISLAINPPSWLGTVTGTFISRENRLRIRKWIRELNTVDAGYQSMAPKIREELTNYFTPEVNRLSEMLGRDLTHWLTSKGR